MTNINQPATPTMPEAGDLPLGPKLRGNRRLKLASGSPTKVRAELNLEKWPGIWQPAKSKNEKTLRVLEREVTNSDGSRIVSRVEVGYTHLGTLTTEDQRMFYALVKQWEDSTKPQTFVFFSDRLLGRILRKGWGTNVRDAVVKSLRKLRTIPLEWINSYHQKTDEGKAVLRERTPFTILSELKIVESEIDGTVNRAVGYFKFDDRILGNLLTNYTKPVLLDTILKIKSDIGQLLYVHVDLMLARKDGYERRTKDLFQDLGLNNPQYARQYERYRALKKALGELQGVPLSTGVIKVARIEKTLDNLDYKVVFRKSVAREIDAPGEEESNPVVIRHYAKAITPVGIQAEEVVQHFHRIVHGVDQHEVQSKELGQALALLSQHGFEKAKHIIQYAADRAAETNFKMQHFGAVLSYTSRAVADYDQSRREPVRRHPATLPTPLARQQGRAAFARGERRLASLNGEQHQARMEQAKADLYRQIPFMALRPRSGGAIEEDMIRSRLIRQLDQEPMDLLPLDAMILPEELRKILPSYTQETPGPTV